jgi:hypothetical protein
MDLSWWQEYAAEKNCSPHNKRKQREGRKPESYFL